MGQARFDDKNKVITVPQFLFFSKKIPLTEIKQKAEHINASGSVKNFRLTLFGDFGEQELSFDNYEGYATFIYEYQKAKLSA